MPAAKGRAISALTMTVTGNATCNGETTGRTIRNSPVPRTSDDTASGRAPASPASRPPRSARARANAMVRTVEASATPNDRPVAASTEDGSSNSPGRPRQATIPSGSSRNSAARPIARPSSARQTGVRASQRSTARSSPPPRPVGSVTARASRTAVRHSPTCTSDSIAARPGVKSKRSAW